MTKRTTKLAAFTFPLIHAVQCQWLALLSFVDDHILGVEKIIEKVFPPSTRLFDKLDEFLRIAETLPGKFDEHVSKFPDFVHQVPFLDFALTFLISWLRFLVSKLTHWGSNNTKEREIRVDINCDNLNIEGESAEQVYLNIESPSHISISASSLNKPEMVRQEHGPVDSSMDTQGENVESYKEMLEKGKKESTENAYGSSKGDSPEANTTEEEVVESCKKDANKSIGKEHPILELFEASWHMKPGKVVLSTYTTFAASAMLVKTVLNEVQNLTNQFIPQQLREKILAKFEGLMGNSSSQMTLVIDEKNGLSINEMFEASEIYLQTKISPSVLRLNVSKAPRDKTFSITINKGEKIIDTFEDIQVIWQMVCTETQKTIYYDGYPSSEKVDRRSIELSFHKKHKEKVTLSGLLNFIDGLWSCCGDERIIVFTTNHKDRLDPALLRPGRMDMHIHMSYCTPGGFKILALNYLGLTNHFMFTEIEKLITEVEATPAEIAEELMKSEEPEVALKGLIKYLHLKKIENVKANFEGEKDIGVEEEEESQEIKVEAETKGRITNKRNARRGRMRR
ncbi:hypothetical protein C3L33_13872, partial [Rhododendron williamsianum]